MLPSSSTTTRCEGVCLLEEEVVAVVVRMGILALLDGCAIYGG